MMRMRGEEEEKEEALVSASISILLVCKDFSFKKIQLRKKNSPFLLFVLFVTDPVWYVHVSNDYPDLSIQFPWL